MNLDKKLFRDLTILLIGLIGMGCFFYSFSQHHPFKAGSIEIPKTEVISRADSIIKSWQYQPAGFYPKATFLQNSQLMDSLQKKWGTTSFQQKTNDSEFLSKLPLLYWKVEEFYYQGEQSGTDLNVELTTDGKLAAFDATTELIKKQRPFNRLAIRTVYADFFPEYDRVFEDSLISGLTEYQHLTNLDNGPAISLEVLRKIQRMRRDWDTDFYPTEMAWKLADFYLNKSIWSTLGLQKDSVQMMDEGGIRFAKAFYSKYDEESDIRVELEVEILPAGGIKSIQYELSPNISNSNNAFSDVFQSISLFLILLFVIGLLFVFYLRIKARAIDTQPAMIIAVLAGFVVPGFVLLQFLNEFGFIHGVMDTSQIINSLMVLAVNGTISAIGFFVITAVSDSVTRQYWPEKLKTWDLVRRGLFRNKPVGWGIINAIGIGGILAGITGFYLNLFDNSYLPSSSRLISDVYYLPSLANLLVTLVMVLIIIVPLFLIIGNQVKNLTRRNWSIPLVSAVIFGLMDIMPFTLEPELFDILLRVTIGFLLGYFYLRYDFLTVVFGFFIFVNLLSTSKGWLLPDSPDANTFYLFVLVVLSIAGLGIYFIWRGSERKELPEYIPAYIEDQAKEQRIKQELSIARAVQQNFLPQKIHHLPGIDIAGVCIPAQETGGDYYDMFPLGDQRTGVAIGDVSGKGIQAAFYMTFTKGVLHSLSTLILSPVEMLNQLNRLFNENATRGTFISMIYGILEADKRQFTFARAGHNPMLLVKNNGETHWLRPKGIGIGVSREDEFIALTEESTLKLDEGDVLILYTDGIVEMLNTGKRFYGEERLEKLVSRVRHETSEIILKQITGDVTEFRGTAKQHDDMTLVIIKADAAVNR